MTRIIFWNKCRITRNAILNWSRYFVFPNFDFRFIIEDLRVQSFIRIELVSDFWPEIWVSVPLCYMRNTFIRTNTRSITTPPRNCVTISFGSEVTHSWKCSIFLSRCGIHILFIICFSLSILTVLNKRNWLIFFNLAIYSTSRYTSFNSIRSVCTE